MKYIVSFGDTRCIYDEQQFLDFIDIAVLNNKDVSNFKVERVQTFKDLQPFTSDEEITRLRSNFSNGYGISVVQGLNTYSGEGTYEVAVLKDNKLCCSTPITDDVIGWVSEEEINEIMEELQSYLPNQYE